MSTVGDRTRNVPLLGGIMLTSTGSFLCLSQRTVLSFQSSHRRDENKCRTKQPDKVNVVLKFVKDLCKR